MREDRTEDAKAFGVDAWVYCKSHLRPHSTGWCTAFVKDKILLDAKDREAAYAECRAKGYELYNDR